MTTIDLDQQLLDELAETQATIGHADVRLVEPWPFPPGPEGPLRLAGGSTPHGAYALAVGDHLELIVAINGWPIEHRRCPGPPPPATPLATPANYWLSQQPILMHVDGMEIASDPSLAVLGRVGRRAKPIGLADVDSKGEADAAVAMAETWDLAVSVEHHGPTSCGGEPVWFVHVARREPMDELFDLDALIEWYPAALEAAGLAELRAEVVAGLEDLRGRSPADFLDRTDELIVAPMSDGMDGVLHTEAIGLLLGYWPPTTAGLLADGQVGEIGGRYGSRRFPGWDALRFALAEERPWLRLGEVGG